MINSNPQSITTRGSIKERTYYLCYTLTTVLLIDFLERVWRHLWTLKYLNVNLPLICNWRLISVWPFAFKFRTFYTLCPNVISLAIKLQSFAVRKHLKHMKQLSALSINVHIVSYFCRILIRPLTLTASEHFNTSNVQGSDKWWPQTNKILKYDWLLLGAVISKGSISCTISIDPASKEV